MKKIFNQELTKAGKRIQELRRSRSFSCVPVFLILALCCFASCADQAIATANQIVGSDLANRALTRTYTQQTRDDLEQLQILLPDLPYEDKVSDRQVGQLAARLDRLFNNAKADPSNVSTINEIMSCMTAGRRAIPPTTKALLAGRFREVAGGIKIGFDYNGGWHDVVDAPADPPVIKAAKARKGAKHP